MTVQVAATVVSAAPTLTPGQVLPLTMDLAGNLNVNVQVGGGGGGSSNVTLAAASAGIVTEGSTVGTAATGFLAMALGTSSTQTFTAGDAWPLTIGPNGSLHVTLGNVANPNSFNSPSSSGGSVVSPIALGGYNSTPYALTTGQTAPIALNTTAAIYVDDESLKNHFSTSFTLTPAATPTDVFLLPGSATKTVRVRRVKISALATTAGSMVFNLVKRSSASTGGTSTAGVAVPMDSNNAAATAAPLVFTANPSSLGTSVGNVDTDLLSFGVSAANPIYDETYGTNNTQAIVLRGAAQCLAINLNGGALPTGAEIAVRVVWSEE